METISDTIREAIEQHKGTQLEIAQGSGVPESVLSRFITGKTSLRLKHADALAQFFGLELRKARKARKTTKGAR